MSKTVFVIFLFSTILHLVFTQSEDSVDCGELVLTGERGEITTPNYPESYPNLITCHWNITIAVDKIIGAKFSYFDVENAEGCIFDKLTIYEDDPSEILHVLCGTTVAPILTSGNVLNLIFESDPFVVGKGFNLTWQSFAKDVLELPTSGVITSPNYPLPYPSKTRTMHDITVTPGMWIELEFNETFGIEGNMEVEGQCVYDYIEIVRITQGDRVLRHRICGDTKPENILFPFDEIQLRFASDHASEEVGFYLEWKAIPDRSCGHEPIVITGEMSGTITNPTYPARFHTPTSCTWEIIAPVGTSIALRFNNFGIVASDNGLCKSTTFFGIWDGVPATDENKYLEQYHCGRRPPRGFLTTGNNVTLMFVTDGNDEFTGFSIDWKVEQPCPEFTCWNGSCISDSKVCDGTKDCPSGYDEMDCTSSQTCGVQEVKPSFQWHARVIGGYEVVPHSWPWQGNLRRQSVAQVAPRFTCGVTIIGEEWAMTAAHCVDGTRTTRYTAHFGGHSRRTFDDNTEQIGVVDRVFLHPEWTGSLTEGVDIALLHFKEPLTFTKYVQPICISTNRSMDPEPGVPSVITGWGQTHQTALLYPEFMQQAVVPIVSPEECLAFVDFANATAEQIEGIKEGHICFGYIKDNGGVGACFGDSGGALVYFVDDHWVQIGITSWVVECAGPTHPSFYTRVSYHYDNFIKPRLTEGIPSVKETNIDISANNGEIPSPGFPGDYPENVKYTWTLTAATDMRILINISYINLEFEDNCLLDSLTIYDGMESGANKFLGQPFCGVTSPPTFRSTSNKVQIVFMSDHVIAGHDKEENVSIGFNILYSVEKNCLQTEFACSSGQCISQNMTCNEHNDCYDDSDENQCEWNTGSTCGQPTKTVMPKIFSGKRSEDGVWPWSVYITNSEDNVFGLCNGVIVSSKWVLSSAYCMGRFSASDGIEIHAGSSSRVNPSSNAQKFVVENRIKHPRYNPDKSVYEDSLELLLTSSEIVFNDFVKPICLSSIEDNEINNCAVAGWGVTNYLGVDYAHELQYSYLSSSSNDLCVKSFSEATASTMLPDNVICAHAKDGSSTCAGDRGSPLVCYKDKTWRLAGVLLITQSCEHKEQAAVFTKISPYAEWIKQVTFSSPNYETIYREVFNDGGSITSPNYPSAYNVGEIYEWRISAVTDYDFLVLTFENDKIDLEQSDNCMHDWLSVYEGSVANPEKQTRYCGNANIPPMEINGKSFFVQFHSNGENTGSGFKLSWEGMMRTTAPGTNPPCTTTTASAMTIHHSALTVGLIAFIAYIALAWENIFS